MAKIPAPMNRVRARAILLNIKKIFDDLKIKFWLGHGTCLGAVREGRFMPYDFDLDAMMLARDFSPKVQKAFAPFHLKRAWPNKPAQISMVRHQIHIHIGLKYYFSPKDIYISFPQRPHRQNATMPGKLLQGLYQVKFLDTVFRVPNPPEEYLEHIYGENWRIPVDPRIKGFNWCKKWERIPDARFIKYVRWIEKHPKEI